MLPRPNFLPMQVDFPIPMGSGVSKLLTKVGSQEQFYNLPPMSTSLDIESVFQVSEVEAQSLYFFFFSKIYSYYSISLITLWQDNDEYFREG